MAVKQLTHGALNALEELYRDAVSLVAKHTASAPDENRFEWATAAHAGSEPRDLVEALTTSGDQYSVHSEDMNRMLGLLGVPGYHPTPGMTRSRLPGEAFLTVHSHPSGRAFPSSGDLIFNDFFPEPDQAIMGVVGTSNRSSPDPTDPIGGVTALQQLIPRGDPMVGKVRDYVGKWSSQWADTLDDPYMRDWAAAQSPRRIEVLEQTGSLPGDVSAGGPLPRDHTVDRMVRLAKRDMLDSILRRYGSAPPLMRAADADLYDLYHSQPNLPGPAYLHGLDSDAMLHDLYDTLMRRGHLDYAEGGLT